MPSGTGLDASLMIGPETTYGTAASVLRGIEFKTESLKRNKVTVEGQGIRGGGRVKRKQRRVVTTRDATGTITCEFVNSFLGPLNRICFGSATSAAGTSTTLAAAAAANATTVTLAAAAAIGDALWIDSGGASPELRFVVATPGTTPTLNAGLSAAHASAVTVLVNGGPSNFLQTFTIGGLQGVSATIQEGIPTSSNGTIEPFTYVGCKGASWDLAVAKGDIAQLSVDIDGRDEQTLGSSPAGPALTTPVYATNAGVFSFLGATINANGAALAAITKAEVKLDNKMTTDRFFLGQGGLKAEPLENDFRAVSGSFDSEFFTRAMLYDAYAGDLVLSTVLALQGATLTGGVPSSASVWLPNLFLNGDSPTVDNPDIVNITTPFEALDDGTNPAITLKVVTADTAL